MHNAHSGIKREQNVQLVCPWATFVWSTNTETYVQLEWRIFIVAPDWQWRRRLWMDGVSHGIANWHEICFLDASKTEYFCSIFFYMGKVALAGKRFGYFYHKKIKICDFVARHISTKNQMTNSEPKLRNSFGQNPLESFRADIDSDTKEN